MIDTLVFSGGGMKIIFFLGLLKYLEENELINNINTFIGSSAGSIISLLISINLNSDDLIKILNNIDINNFTNFTNNFDIMNILDNYGLFDFDYISNMISIIIKNKLNLNNLDEFTFKKHYEITNKKIKIIGSNITDNKSECFSIDDTPDMKILDSIIISCNVPLLFKKVEYNNKLYSDGGLFNHYPIKHSDNLDTTLGIYLKIKYNDCDSLLNYILNILNILYDKELNNLDNKYKLNTIFLDSDIDFYDFDINKDTINKCIDIGYNYSKTFIQEHSDFKKLIKES